MSKGLITKKSTKKEPAKTMKEKKAAKREKKNEKNNSGLLNKQVVFLIYFALYVTFISDCRK